jgi:hypothetical protein
LQEFEIGVFKGVTFSTGFIDIETFFIGIIIDFVPAVDIIAIIRKGIGTGKLLFKPFA